MSSIIEGDGSWQVALDAGRCPKCGSSTETQLAPSFKKTCTSCKLTIIDSTPVSDAIVDDTMPSEWESGMYETRLMPTEEQIFSDVNTKPMIEWSEAVSAIDALVREKLDYMDDYPDDYSDKDKKYLEVVWNRILRG